MVVSVLIVVVPLTVVVSVGVIAVRSVRVLC